jgi:hypothetical protein
VVDLEADFDFPKTYFKHLEEEDPLVVLEVVPEVGLGMGLEVEWSDYLMIMMIKCCSNLSFLYLNIWFQIREGLLLMP